MKEKQCIILNVIDQINDYAQQDKFEAIYKLFGPLSVMKMIDFVIKWL